MTEPNIFTKIGGRRFFVTMVCLAAATVLCVIDKMTGGEWVATIGLITAFYNAANTLQKVSAGSEQ